MPQLISILLILASSGAVAAERKIECPAEVPAHTVQLNETPTGWSSFVPARFLLHSAGVTVGPFEHNGVQLGEHQKLDRKRFKVIYRLGDWEGEKWLTCQYGGDGGIVLGQKLPNNTGQCEVLYTPDGQGWHTIEIYCKY